MKHFKRMLSLILCCLMLATMFAGMGISASAANYSTAYQNYPEPTVALTLKNPTMKGEYVKWFQCAINYLCTYGDKLTGKKLNTAYKLDVDGSFGPASQNATKAFQSQYGLEVDGAFGPASRAKMKSVLKIGTQPASKLTAYDINVVLQEIMQTSNPVNVYSYYSNPVYWTAPNPNYILNTCTQLAPRSTVKENYWSNGKKYYSYHYIGQYGASQCYGFADYVLARAVYKKTGKVFDLASLQQRSDWSCKGYTKLTGNITSLQIGDIVRIGPKNGTTDGHSAIVMDYNASTGEYSFAECWGGQNSLLKIGGGMESGMNNNRTLAQIKNNYRICWVIRYTG